MRDKRHLFTVIERLETLQKCWEGIVVFANQGKRAVSFSGTILLPNKTPVEGSLLSMNLVVHSGSLVRCIIMYTEVFLYKGDNSF